MQKVWTGSPEDFQRAAKVAGVDLEKLAEQKQVTADAIAQEQNEAAIAQISAPPSPAGYKLTYPNAGALDTRELTKFDEEVRSAFHKGGVPQSLAQGLLDALVRTANTYAGMAKPEAHELRHREEGARFSKLSGDTAENVRLAQVAYNALPQSFRQAMDAQKGFHSAASQAALLQVGRAIEERERRKAKK